MNSSLNIFSCCLCNVIYQINTANISYAHLSNFLYSIIGTKAKTRTISRFPKNQYQKIQNKFKQSSISTIKNPYEPYSISTFNNT